MSKTYSAGIVTAYGAAKRAGYQGTYEDFCRQQAEYAESAAAVEQAKTTAVNAAATATTKAGEATTAATAAQTAKAQTEQAASQALTDIAAARSGAISAVQTEGQTQTANARAQAQAAAQSATTASAKASEASASATTATTKATEAAASATSAAQSASSAQNVLDSIPEDYSDLSEDVDKLKADLSDVNNEVFKIDNISIPITYTRKYISSTGNWYTSSSSSASDYFAVVPNQRIVLSGVFLANQKCIAAFYANKTFASKIAGDTNDTTVSFVVPEDCYYIAVTAPLDATTVEGKIFLSSNIKENSDKIQELELEIGSFNKTIQFFLTDILRELAWTITNGDGLIESFEQIMGSKSIVVSEPYNYALINGEYVTKTGIIEGYTSWSRTNAIPCDSVDFLVFTGNGTVFTTAGYSVFYDKDMNFISNFTVTLTDDITSVTIPVPKNANTFIISASTRQFANLVSIVPTRGE